MAGNEVAWSVDPGILLVKQARANVRTWLPDLKATLTSGVAAAVAWALFVIMGLPWFFGAARYVATAIG